MILDLVSAKNQAILPAKSTAIPPAKSTTISTKNVSKIPTTVFTGFLGSGKTTVIKHLVEYLAQQGEKVAYVKNEIGAEDFDTALIQGEHIQTKELLNGCICCTLVGPFMAAIDELADSYQIDRIIIETAGTADPASMALSVSNHPRLSRDGVITIVDVVNFDGYEDLSLIAKRQAQLTDLIVFNKIELVDLDRKQAVVGYVRELNETAPIVEAPDGVLNPQVAFGISSAGLEKELLELHEVEKTSKVENTSPHLPDLELSTHAHSHSHESQDGIDAHTFVSDTTFDKMNFIAVISRLPKTVIRLKGVIHFDSGWEVVNTVYRRFDSYPLTQEMKEKITARQKEKIITTRLILIGYKVNDDAHALHDLLLSASLHDEVVSSTPQLS